MDQFADPLPAGPPHEPVVGAEGWVEEKPEDLARGPRATTFHVLFGILGAYLILNFLGGVFIGFLQIFFADAALTQRFVPHLGVADKKALYVASLTNLAMFGLLPMAWVYGTRVKPWLGGNRYLKFKDTPRALLKGTLLGIGLMVAVTLISLLYTVATEGPDALTATPDETDNPVVQAILDNLTIPLAIVIAITAGFGEEILFRGVLQKWIGWWPQAIVFGLSHAIGGDPLQIIVTGLIGLLFGWLIHRGHSMWLVIAAHFSYDLALLSFALAAL